MPFQQSTERFLAPSPQVLFPRPPIGGTSVVIPQCYQQNLFNGDPSLILNYFILSSDVVPQCLGRALVSDPASS